MVPLSIGTKGTSNNSLHLVYDSKTCLHLVPAAWRDIPSLYDGGTGNWNSAKDLLRFEILQKEREGRSIHLIIGPSEDQDLRRRVFEAFRAHKLYQGRPELSGFWHRLFRLDINTADEENSMSIYELERRFDLKWEKFLESVLPEITDVFVELFKGE